jgi:hypothetical protein
MKYQLSAGVWQERVAGLKKRKLSFETTVTKSTGAP